MATPIQRLVDLASSPDTQHAQAVDCCADELTYSQLLALVQAIAHDLQTTFGPRPIIAIVSENTPFTLATILATWLIAGVAAPLDVHAPDALLRGMLHGVKPAAVVVPDTAAATIALVQDAGYVAHPFKTAQSAIPALLAKYTAPAVPRAHTDALPSPDDDALYVYTSSASSVDNLKCVPITHATLYNNAALELKAWRVRSGSGADPAPAAPERFRTLGWGPFSHIMALANDLTCHTLLPAGCYIFATPPSTYPSNSNSDAGPQQGKTYDPGALLLATARRARPDLIAGVPWLYKRMMDECARDPALLAILKRCRQLMAGGARVDPEVQRWADEHGLKMDVSVGMTEVGGALFEVEAGAMGEGGGYPADQCLVEGATLTLLDEDGKESDTYGELVITSKYISKGYRNFTSTAHFPAPNGATSFRTGDMYSRLSSPEGARLRWEGRRDDYIQLGSAELLDPRKPEAALAASPAIARAALVGNTFLRGAADFVCAIVELPPVSVSASDIGMGKGEGGFDAQGVLQAFASVNRDLHPPLRVPVSRVLVLNAGETLPVNRKGLVWRKALEERYGDRLQALLREPGLSRFSAKVGGKGGKKRREGGWEYERVEGEVMGVVAKGLGIEKELLAENRASTFAELGMDSNMATRIVSALNAQYGVDFPMSACHDHVDVEQLARALLARLTHASSPSPSLSSPSHTPERFSAADDDVVIIGQAFRLPGEVSTPAAFWRALMEKERVLADMRSPSFTRWDHSSFYHPPTPPSGSPQKKPPAGMINFTQMGLIDVARYDNAFFGVSPAEAYFVTPGARVAMEVAVEALEDAGCPLRRVKGSSMAVFVAQGPEFGYPDLIYTEKGFEVYDRYYGTGVADSAISGRLSYFLDIHGPSVTLNTACSGGLVALDNAMSAIRSGQCESAIVSSVNVHVWPGNFGFLSANQMSSLHGRCATFSAEADGYVPSEGAVAFVVKSRRAALRDGDNILGVVKATAVQHNGRSQGLVAPNSKAQVALQRTVLAGAGFQPKDIDFVENHGTGTILGDMMEIQAINEVFAGSHTEAAPLVLGAAKTVFGHTESSAGLVGVAKALQTLRHGVVPGLAHLTGDNLSPRLDTAATPLRISHLPTVLPRRENDLPLRALSLSFGFAGTIAAVVLEEYKPPAPSPLALALPAPTSTQAIAGPHLFVVSAKTEKALRAYLHAYLAFCASARDADLPHICYSAAVAREHYRFRFACACASVLDLKSQIEGALERAEKGEGMKAVPAKPRVGFAFAGQGAQWAGMGRALADADTVFAAHLRDYAAQASALLGTDIAPLLFEVPEDAAGAGAKRVNETHVAQSCIFVFQCAMVRWLGHVGVRPDVTVAHSLGEVAAAVASDAMDFETALAFVRTRSDAMRPENTNGGLMAAVRAPEELIARRIAALGLAETVVIAAYNTGTQHVVSGDEGAVRALVEALAKEGVKGTVLSVNQGFHSHCIEKSLTPIFEHLKHESDNIQRPNIPHYSSVKGRALKSDERQDADYWVRQARQPVRFADAAKAMLTEANLTAVVDLGPQNVITHLLKDAATAVNAPAKVALLPVCDRPATNTLTPLVQALAALFMLGAGPDFEKLYAGSRARASRVPIPTYPWQRQRHYPNIIPSRTTRIRGSEAAPRAYAKRWSVGRELGPLLREEHTANGVPIVPAAALAMFVCVEARRACDGATVEVDIKYQKPLLLEDAERDVLALEIAGDKVTCTHFRGDAAMGVICSGALKVVSSGGAQPQPAKEKANAPDSSIDQKATYEKFSDGLVRFGPSFRCIQAIDRYEKASARIAAPPSGNAQHDFVRALDAVLHMFGAVAPETPAELVKAGGAFLPAAVGGLTVHVGALPERFVCEYRLPIRVAQGGRRMTAEFRAYGEKGELLVSCREYVVAWVPSSAGGAAAAKAPKQVEAAQAPTTTPAPVAAPKAKAQRAEKVTKEAVQKFVAGSLETILGLTEADMENFDASTPILSLGLDSISYTQLRSDVMDKYAVDLPLSFLGEEGLALSEYADFVLANGPKAGPGGDAAAPLAEAESASESGESSSGTAKTKDSEPTATSATSFVEVTAKEAETFIAKSLQDVLGMTAEDMKGFDSSTPVLTLGLDSISFTQLRADVLKEYNVDLPMTFLGEDELTLGELAAFTVDKTKEVPASA